MEINVKLNLTGDQLKHYRDIEAHCKEYLDGNHEVLGNLIGDYEQIVTKEQWDNVGLPTWFVLNNALSLASITIDELRDIRKKNDSEEHEHKDLVPVEETKNAS